jgi:glycosyltransferase involved in cell wall biosynthesis
MSVRMLWHLRWMRRLPPRNFFTTVQIGQKQTVSVVLAARDEAHRVQKTVRGLLEQQEVNLEIIVVDDRSSDESGEILRKLAAEDKRVKVIRVDVLPPDWLGKCHACYLGANAATGEWILFTDADCWLKKNVIIRALSLAAFQGADHITLTPGIVEANVGASAWHLAFLLSLADWVSGVNRDQPKRFLGMGAFNLVRSSAYRACGGYEALRLTVVDDVKLGLLLRRAGFRTRGCIGGDDTLCDWGTTLGSIIRIMEKNYFAALDYRLGAVIAVGLILPTLWGLAILGFFTATLMGMFAGVALFSLIVPAWVVARRLGWSIGPALITPLVFPMLFYAILRSTLITLKQGGIRWRGTFYPLDGLRRGNVR